MQRLFKGHQEGISAAPSSDITTPAITVFTVAWKSGNAEKLDIDHSSDFLVMEH